MRLHEALATPLQHTNNILNYILCFYISKLIVVGSDLKDYKGLLRKALARALY